MGLMSAHRYYNFCNSTTYTLRSLFELHLIAFISRASGHSIIEDILAVWFSNVHNGSPIPTYIL